MKTSNMITALLIVALCLGGWIVAGTQIISQNETYIQYIEQADEWVERGLYQRAIGNYTLALEEKPTTELYEKIDKAYQLRYEEAPEETLEDYMDYLEDAVAACPGNEQIVDSFVKIYLSQEKYEDSYQVLKKAIAAGYDSDEVQKTFLSVRYAFALKSSGYQGILPSLTNVFPVKREQGWNLYEIGTGMLVSKNYSYISHCNEEGTYVVTGEDSRLIDGDGIVLGIFEKPVTDAGLFADGLVPASFGGEYNYYDAFAEKQFGGYQVAGTFQDGLAAVQKDNKWMLIDTEGNSESDEFERIVLDPMGQYLINGYVIAKDDGEFGIYDKNMNLKAELDCSDVDILTEDGLVAVCKDGKWGFANMEGEIVIKHEYEQARSFSNGLAAVCKDGQWGFIEPEGNLVIDYQFADVGYMTEAGICPVRIDSAKEEIPNQDKPAEQAYAEEDDSEQETIPEAPNQSTELWVFLQLKIGIKED